MPEAYRDRGIIKWAPFDSLVGYHSLLQEMKQRLKKRPKPILSEDELEALNRKLRTAYEKKREIECRYYRKGYFVTTCATITRLDFVYRRITLSTRETIPADDVLSITLLDDRGALDD
ncbi:MAG: YolD-like family protein [Acholeplasmataceae bacterium]